MKITETLLNDNVGVSMHLAKDDNGRVDVAVHFDNEEVFHGTLDSWIKKNGALELFTEKAVAFSRLVVPIL